MADFLTESESRAEYGKTLNDVKDWFERHSKALKILHLNNQKGVGLLLRGMAENADIMREFGEDAVILMSGDKKKVYLVRPTEVDG